MSIGSVLQRLLARFTSTTADLHHWTEMYPGMVTASGERVTSSTAMGLSAFFACMRNIAEDVGKLPLHVYRKQGRDRIEQPEHAVDYLLSTEPNANMTAQALREMVTAHACAFGAGYAEIVRDGADAPVELWPLDPTTVSTELADGRLTYVITINGIKHVLMQSQVFHVHGISADGLTGYNIVQIAREALGGAIASQSFGSSFYGKGTHLGGILKHPGSLSDQALAHLRKSFEARYTGADNVGKVYIAEEGMTYEQLGIAPEQAQYIESRKFDLDEVARFFRMPPHKIQSMERATFSNIEHQSLEYVGDTLMPWLVRWEQEAKRKLFTATERPLFVKHNVAALLRADAVARSQYYATMLQNGVYSVNEVRALEDANSIKEGDDHHIQVNMQVLGAPPPAPAPAPAPVVPEPDDERVARVIRAHVSAIADAYKRVLRTETEKLTRAHKRGDLDAWAVDFYRGHAGHVRAALLPIVQTICDTARVFGAVDPDPLEMLAHVHQMAVRHVEASVADLTSPAIVAWSHGRAERQAEVDAAHLVELLKPIPQLEAACA